MTTEFELLRRAAIQAKVKANDAHKALKEAVDACKHQWGEISSYHVPPFEGCHTVTIWWKRTCTECGEEQSTARYTETTTRTPKFD